MSVRGGTPEGSAWTRRRRGFLGVVPHWLFCHFACAAALFD
jgi:hypothetical protein